jgi:hypothetical protein
MFSMTPSTSNVITYRQWRTVTIIVGGAKGHYMVAEAANLKYFVFCMIKNGTVSSIVCKF